MQSDLDGHVFDMVCDSLIGPAARIRVASEFDRRLHHLETHALQDGQRAIRLVRSRAEQWKIDPGRIGMLVDPGPLGIPDSISDTAPPTFLLVANDDSGAARGIVDLIPKLRRAAVPVDAHIDARGGHALTRTGVTH